MKIFYAKQHLTIHIKSAHDKVKEVECETCGKVFVEKYNLKRHIRKKHGHYPNK